jgi:hypothetical protein
MKWVLTTAKVAGINDLPCLPKHDRALDKKFWSPIQWPLRMFLSFRDCTPSPLTVEPGTLLFKNVTQNTWNVTLFYDYLVTKTQSFSVIFPKHNWNFVFNVRYLHSHHDKIASFALEFAHLETVSISKTYGWCTLVRRDGNGWITRQLVTVCNVGNGSERSMVMSIADDSSRPWLSVLIEQYCPVNGTQYKNWRRDAD